jgi:hypothetical protein
VCRQTRGSHRPGGRRRRGAPDRPSRRVRLPPRRAHADAQSRSSSIPPSRPLSSRPPRPHPGTGSGLPVLNSVLRRPPVLRPSPRRVPYARADRSTGVVRSRVASTSPRDLAVPRNRASTGRRDPAWTEGLGQHHDAVDPFSTTWIAPVSSTALRPCPGPRPCSSRCLPVRGRPAWRRFRGAVTVLRGRA